MNHRVIACSFVVLICGASVVFAQATDGTSRNLSPAEYREQSGLLMEGIGADVRELETLFARAEESEDQEMEACVGAHLGSARGAENAADSHYEELLDLAGAADLDPVSASHELLMLEILRERVAGYVVQARACFGESAVAASGTETRVEVDESFEGAGAAGPGERQMDEEDDFVEDRTGEATPFF